MDEKKKVLVVEDNEHTRFLVNAILHSMGYEVHEAQDGAEALEKLQSKEFAESLCVVLLDILMPKVNGLDVLKQIKENGELSQLPVIMLTTRDMAEDLIEGYNTGADYYIPKPFTRQQLLYGLGLVLHSEDEVQAQG